MMGDFQTSPIDWTFRTMVYLGAFASIFRRLRMAIRRRSPHVREWSVALAYLVLLGVLAIKAPEFYQADQLRTFFVSNAPLLTTALGMTLVIIVREIDISVGSQFSICGVVAGLLAKAGLPMPLVILSTLFAGSMMGALNGFLVAIVGLPSIVVTLATMVILRESLRWWREGEFVYNLPDGFQWLGLGQAGGQWAIVLIAAIVFVVMAWGTRNLTGFRAIYAVGSDHEAARLVGIRPKRVVFGVFVTMGILTALASLLNGVRFADVDPNSGTGLELQVIAAAVVGGTAISGGRGTPVGTLLGVALLGTIGPALVFLGTQPQWEKAVQGLIILAAVASDSLGGKRR